jgi:hypothetical protein
MEYKKLNNYKPIRINIVKLECDIPSESYNNGKFIYISKTTKILCECYLIDENTNALIKIHIRTDIP